MIIFENENKCEEGYFVSLGQNGGMIDYAQTTYKCEIDLYKQYYNSSEGRLDQNIIEVLKEEETVIDLSDTSNTLDNAETSLKLYYQYFEIQPDGFLLELTSPSEFIEDRDFIFASMELLKEEDINSYERSELRDIKNEILASYGHLFDSKAVQEFYDQVEWYKPIGDITDRLTDIENRNIALINKLLLR